MRALRLKRIAVRSFAIIRFAEVSQTEEGFDAPFSNSPASLPLLACRGGSFGAFPN